MTPLIDVMLVLLVIFMITAPLMTSSLRLDLPRVDAAPATDSAPVVRVAIDAQGQLYLEDQPLELSALVSALRGRPAAAARPDVQLRADRSVPYGKVAELIAQLQQAGLNRIGFVTVPDSASAR